MSFEIRDSTMLWHHDGKTDVIFEEMSLKFPMLCGFRATTMDDVSDMIFKKNFSCKIETWLKYRIIRKIQKFILILRKTFLNSFLIALIKIKSIPQKS